MDDIKAGVYRHYKGPLYLVLGLAHDANADTLYPEVALAHDVDGEPLGERTVVVYVGLQLDDAHTGPRLAVRTAEDFFAWVHQEDGSACPTHVGDDNHFCFCDGGQEQSGTVPRFEYVGPTWEGQH